MFGIPPASETTSGRLATENSARISEAVIPGVRAAYRSAGGTELEPVRGTGTESRVLPAGTGLGVDPTVSD